MIITPTTTSEQDITLANNNVIVDELMKTLIEYKLNWMKDRSGAYEFNNCSLTVNPADGSITLTTGQVNFLKLDFGSDDPPNNDPIANIATWIQNYIDETTRHLDAGEGLII